MSGSTCWPTLSACSTAPRYASTAPARWPSWVRRCAGPTSAPRRASRCGAATLARRAYDELLATGETVRRHSPIGVESLTPSERRVSRMAASGVTNRQIAEALFLTIKTIESHLAAAFDKLGVHSRGELPRALTGRASRA